MSSEAEPTIAQLMQTLLADKKLREQELAEAKTRREQELKEEHHHYEEALAKRDADMKVQMDLICGLVEGIKTCGEPLTVIHADRDHEIKVTKLTDADDIEAD